MTTRRDAAAARDPLFGSLYDELRRLARLRLAELPPGRTLQPTDLVHEAWLRLSGRESPLPLERGAVMFLVARAMRDLVVEDARRKASLKRGGPSRRVPFEEALTLPGTESDEVLAVSDALEQLEAQNLAAAEVVDLRYFGGLTVPEVAEALGRSVSTVERQWVYARAWLRRAMDAESGSGAGTRGESP